MITVDDIHDVLDNDQDIHDAVARWISMAKSYDVISLSNYRNLRCRHQGWKPVTLQEYRLKLKGDRVALKKLQDDLCRQARNTRIQNALERENVLNDFVD